MAELRSVNKALTALGDAGKQKNRPGKAPPERGTVNMLRRFVNEVLQPGDVTCPEAATKWMLANGWRTGSRTPQTTVNSAMSHMAERGGEGLEWAGTGKYQKVAPDGS